MYKTIVVKEFKNDDAITIQSSSLSELRKGVDATKFLVKIHAFPINPLDLSKLSGEISEVKTPFTPGSEASGVIVEAQNKSLVGKKVSLASMIGTWREYILVAQENVIFLNDDADLDSAACGFINPMTSQGLIHTAQKYNAKGVVNLAAQSALGKMINDLAKEKGLNCLNVIRGDLARVNEIKQQYNNENVITIDQDPQQFQKQIKELTEKLSATVCFDPIGGHVSGQVFNNLPHNSHLVVYGSLSGKEIEGINGVELRWGNKKIEGFVLFNWVKSITVEERRQAKQYVALKSKSIFRPQIEKSFQLSEIKNALTFFRGLKGGKKVLLKV